MAAFFTDELRSLLAAGVPLIHLVTHEEERAERMIEAAAAELALGMVRWDVADGFAVVRSPAEPFAAKDCAAGEDALRHISERMPQKCVAVLRDFHHAWKQKPSIVTRRMRNMVSALRAGSRFIIVISPDAALPVELQADMVRLHVPLPGADELRSVFQHFTGRLERSALPSPEVATKIVGAALGLTEVQARRAFGQAYAANQRFDARAIDIVTWAKREVVRESGALEFLPAAEAQADVGGLENLKGWLRKREKGFSQEARDAGVPFPRGVVLMGIPGTGKSLTARLTSSLWKLPLLRLDMGSLFGSLLGESESQMRKAIALAETVSPCILWIDEMEKGFAGTGVGSINAGAATRVFGTFLTWMQERTTPVFVIATANDVSGLAPELMARFDATFFLNLPTDAELRAIWLIHLERAGITFPERELEINELLEKSRGYVGREIERVVREAQFTAFADSNRVITQADLLSALKDTVPISRSHAEAVKELERWVTEGRAFPASAEASRAVAGGRVIIA
jgi:hypothetical protein